MKKETTVLPGRIPVEIPGNGGLLEVGTVPAFQVVSDCDSGDFCGVYLTFKRHSGRVVGIICQCASDARRLPGFERIPPAGKMRGGA